MKFSVSACECWCIVLPRKERLMRAPGRDISTVRADNFVDFVQQYILSAENSAWPTVGDRYIFDE